MPGAAVTIVPEPVWQVDALLGEGPMWSVTEQTLRFVDIAGGRLHRFCPDDGVRETIALGGRPSFIVPEDGGALLIGRGTHVERLIGESLMEVVATVPGPDGIRTNDATVDAAGRLWFGTMDDAELRPTGAIWCLGGGTLTRAGGEAVVTNGPALSADGRWIYYVDSLARTIWRSPLGVEPCLADPQVFVQLADADGYPDGIVVDSEDCLWVALWDGWGVRRYGPDGALLLHVPLPCARVTKLALGGADLTTAFVTTARIGLDDAARGAQPLAGSLFAFTAPAPGRALPQVARG